MVNDVWELQQRTEGGPLVAENAALRAENERLTEKLDECRTQRDTAIHSRDARIAELERALRPFADVWKDSVPEKEVEVIAHCYAPLWPQDFRRAADALKEPN
jgi:uncharacterized protein YPO0396